jgi:hypothetical protein
LRMDYFGPPMVHRQRLLWAVATRRQLDRWEPLVAASVRLSFQRQQLTAAEIWLGEIEHHFALIAARHLLRALDLDPSTGVVIDQTIRDELLEGRDLHEHWDENMPVFNMTPRTALPPRRSGKSFAARNPREGPYGWWGWSSNTGPELLPNVPAAAVHDVLDAVEMEVLDANESLARFLPERPASPWIQNGDGWWPMPDSHTPVLPR